MSPVRIALVGLLVAGALHAQPVTFSSPRAGQSLEAGQVVEVRFSGVPEDVEELELLLVAGRDHRLSLRMTESLDPQTRSFVWTVPNLSMPDATLVLRMDLDGREVESGPSEPFEIESSRSGLLAQLELRAGEVWIGPETEARHVHDGLPGADLGGGAARLELPSAETAFVLPQPAPDVPESKSRTEPAGLGAGAPAHASEPPALSRVPRSVPRRI